MNTSTAIQKSVEKIEKTTSRKFPVTPIALVTGPKFELSVGDPDQPFFIASVDKVFIATLIAQLFDSGYCALDTPIGQLLPAADLAPLPVAEGVQNFRDITVEHLLSHTSGLPDVMLPPRGYETQCSIPNLYANPDRLWTLREFLAQAEHLPPFAKPGTRFLYSDTAYFLLIRIIEEAGNVGFAELLRTRIFEPSGMLDSVEWMIADRQRMDQLMSNLAPFWLGDNGSDYRALARNLTWHSGLGGISTVNDLVRFQRALHSGELCNLKWVRMFGTPRNRFRPGIHYGTGMVALRFAGFFPLLRGYPQPTGGLGYTATHMFYYPEQDTHVVLNYHAHRRMQASFQMHIRLARLIKQYG